MKELSEIVVEVPPINYKKPDLSFGEIFGGIAAEFVSDEKNKYTCHHYWDEYSITDISKMNLISSAVKFLERNIPRKFDPIRVVQEALSKYSRLNPGQWEIAFPVENFLGLKEKTEALKKADENKGQIRVIENGYGKRIKINQYYYERIFGQIISAVMAFSNQRGWNTPLKIPKFCRGNSREEIRLNYLPEKLENGVIIVEGNVGNFCGKNSSGGKIIINGNANQTLGDNANKVDFYVNGNVSSIGSSSNCNYYICGGLADKNEIERLSKRENLVIEGKEAREKYDWFLNNLHFLAGIFHYEEIF